MLISLIVEMRPLETRIRKRAMEVIKLLKDMRAEIIEVRNDRKENK